METTILQGYIGIMEKTMETTGFGPKGVKYTTDMPAYAGTALEAPQANSHKSPGARDNSHAHTSCTWVVVKIMGPFWIPIILRHLIFRVPKKGP